MECNKDEAIRAKAIAEKKFDDKDFAGARKFILKAQTLYPGLDGISQMLITINVFISSENKVNGESDWYRVLDLKPSDDDETIRKQYRKLALMLHPDKNKSVGADGAFKILSEAWSTLSDKDKRLAYNQRRNLRGFQVQQKVVPQSGRPSAAPGFNNFANRATSSSKPKGQNSTTSTRTHPASVPNRVPSRAPPPPPSSPLAVHQTDSFWTICPGCKMHYEYHKMHLNQTLLCPNCHKPFLAAPFKIPKPGQLHQNSSHHAPSRATSKTKSQFSTTSTRTHPASVPNHVPSQAPAPAVHQTDSFWTICHGCKMHYEYLKVHLNNTILCPNCHQPFHAAEMTPPTNIPKPDLARGTQATGRMAPGPGSYRNTNIHWSSRTKVPGNTGPSVASKAANVVQQVSERLRRDSEELYAQQPSKRRREEDGVKIPF